MEPVTPNSIGETFSKLFDTSAVNQILLYTEYFLIAALIIGVLFGVYYITKFRYKVFTPKFIWAPDGRTAKICGWKKDKAATIKSGGVKKQQMLWSRKKIEPFREEDILPGNKVYIFKINDDGTYISMPNIDITDDICHFEQITPEENFWAIMQLKENAKAYQDVDLQKRIMMYSMITVVICLAMVIFTVWLCLKAPNKVADSVNQLAPYMENFVKSIGGVPPG